MRSKRTCPACTCTPSTLLHPAIAAAAGRPARQRTTLYGEPPAERLTTGLASDGHLPEPLPVLSG
ncbi:hypothetical protein C1J01_01040 [Nonomuraea aridisoli]|uniref:Uncharacterized protein n=1 Tax=Nonomuraea aridisoli TaxID=2070368 RepID=A0A2W2G9P7_9ACTN|nr:hypothetical protein C1J01_01040 [Nonomuraea aridisoli]